MEEPEEKRRYLVVVIYDIVDNKKRYNMAKYLKGFGFRVQRSAFECILDGSNYKKLINGIGSYINKDDLLRVYKLSGNADVQTWGDVGKTVYDDFVII